MSYWYMWVEYNIRPSLYYSDFSVGPEYILVYSYYIYLYKNLTWLETHDWMSVLYDWQRLIQRKQCHPYLTGNYCYSDYPKNFSAAKVLSTNIKTFFYFTRVFHLYSFKSCINFLVGCFVFLVLLTCVTEHLAK